MNRKALLVEILEAAQQRADDHVLVTAGRAAQMLRMDVRHVRLYAHAGELCGDWVEGSHSARGDRDRQLVLTKGEVRRFRQLLEDRRRRRPTRAAQRDLPLVSTTRATPQPWTWAAFRPRMRMMKSTIPAEGSGSGSWSRGKAQRSKRIA